MDHVDNKTALMARAATHLAEVLDLLKESSDPEAGRLAGQSKTLIRELRHYTEDIEALIRECAAKGMGKHETAEALGLSRYRFRLIADLLTDIKWTPAAHTVGRKRYNDQIKGNVPKSEKRNAALAAGLEILLEKRRIYNICGVQGTAQELFDIWKDYCEVSYSSVTARIRGGMDLFEALFTPRRPSAVDNCAKTRAHRKELSRRESMRFAGGTAGAARTFRTSVLETPRGHGANV